MCGIAGVLYVDERSPGEILHKVSAMCGAQAHRGPDSAGAWSSRQVGLGCARLAITGGQATGSQPFRDAQGGLSVFNGEIYNAPTLAAKLGGIEWRANSCDGTALIGLLGRDGPAALADARGPFALARFDPAAGRLLLARDAVGKKPLYIASIDGGWAFASTLRALQATTGALTRRDDAILEYLVYRSVGGLGSAYRGIAQVPPGGWIELDLDGNRREGRWWSLPEHCDTALDERGVYELVSESVLLRHEPERPTAVFLSGGLDSSIVATTLGRARPEAELWSLSIGYDVAGHEDETDYAAQLAAHAQIRHERITLTAGEVPDLLDEAARLTEDPIQDPVTLPTIKLARAAASQTKVALTGDGSDEVWGGYKRFDRAPADFAAYLARTTIFQPEELGLADGPNSYLDGVEMPPRSLSPLDQILRFEVSNRMRNYHLARIDKICMGSGLEPRSPFLDIRVVSKGLTLSAAAKRPLGIPKGLLVNAFRDQLPDWLIRRRKQPFTVPIGAWLAGPLRAFAHDMLLARNSFARSFVDPRPLLGALNGGQRMDDGAAHRVWSLLQIESWHQGIGRELESAS